MWLEIQSSLFEELCLIKVQKGLENIYEIGSQKRQMDHKIRSDRRLLLNLEQVKLWLSNVKRRRKWSLFIQ